MDSFLKHFSLSNILRQLFCGVAFLVPFILFRWDVLDAWMKVGDEYSMPKIWLGVAMLILFGTLLYHMEKNIVSYGYDVLRAFVYKKGAGDKGVWYYGAFFVVLIVIALGCCGSAVWVVREFVVSWVIGIVVCAFVIFLIISLWRSCHILIENAKPLTDDTKRMAEYSFSAMAWRKFDIWKEEAAAGDDRRRLWAHASKWSDMIHCGMTSAIACLLGIAVMQHVEPKMPVPKGAKVVQNTEKAQADAYSAGGLVCHHGGCGKTPNISIFCFNYAQTKDADSSPEEKGIDSKGGWVNLDLSDGEAVLFWFCVFIIGLELFCMWHRDIQLDLMLQYGCDKKTENEGGR